MPLKLKAQTLCWSPEQQGRKAGDLWLRPLLPHGCAPMEGLQHVMAEQPKNWRRKRNGPCAAEKGICITLLEAQEEVSLGLPSKLSL